ncbi:unnamed protein product [Prorocentrum cordatum]|uniref:Uncharacterized protein n=1 Tax=Prorocentrum cordatum TaxID=2364126 RepID=A0ABN9TAI7_9DINO|nr:unnamed protein product [Polarella glacialis]
MGRIDQLFTPDGGSKRRAQEESWPDQVPEEVYINAFQQVTALTSRVFASMYGQKWFRKCQSKLDFSADRFCLETLEGPELGLFHPGLSLYRAKQLNVARNKLADIECLNRRREGGRFEFEQLSQLRASWNSLTWVRLELPTLVEVDLSYNDLERLPGLKPLTALRYLALSHNRIDDNIFQLAENSQLQTLNLSSNRLSWKPSCFLEQIRALDSCMVVELQLWPNPFAGHFREYQFLTLTHLSGLRTLDGVQIDAALRSTVRMMQDDLASKGAIDYGLFDASVAERQRCAEYRVVDGPLELAAVAAVPCMATLQKVLADVLDCPDQASQHMETFEELVSRVQAVPYSDRRRLMRVEWTSTWQGQCQGDDGRGPMRDMSEEEEESAAHDFEVAVQQVLGRHGGVQGVVLRCLVRLISCASRALSRRCGRLLSDVIEAMSDPELSPELEELMHELWPCLLPGTPGINEFPMDANCRYRGIELPDGVAVASTFDGATEAELLESICILGSLGQFVNIHYESVARTLPSTSFARALRPLVPLLCREARGKLGKDMPYCGWAAYCDRDAFAGESADVVEVPSSGAESLCKEQCVARGFGGFVLSRLVDQPGVSRVEFKAQPAELLVGLRRAGCGRTLWVRPFEPRHSCAARSTEAAVKADDHLVWLAWVNCVRTLVVAGRDGHAAAMCITGFQVHQTVAHHIRALCKWAAAERHHFGQRVRECDVQTARIAEKGGAIGPFYADCRAGPFHVMLQLLTFARELVMAPGEAGLEAAKYFVENEIHRCLFKKLRQCLIENGHAIASREVQASGVDVLLEALVSELVSALTTLVRYSTDEVADVVMQELGNEAMDVFGALLHIAAEPVAADPMLLATALDLIHVALESDVTRAQAIPLVLEALDDGLKLLPYIREPRLPDGRDNRKFQDLWYQCICKYNRDTHQCAWLIEQKGDDWRSHVPGLTDLQQPLIHAVLIGVVKIFTIFSCCASMDLTGRLRQATWKLHRSGRNQLLANSNTGLVTCPSHDVKICCIRCIREVLHSDPEQFSLMDVGSLVSHLTSASIGVSKQEEFLMEVLDLCILLVRDSGVTGHSFRETYATMIIREAYSMLRTSVGRAHAEALEPDQMAMRRALIFQILELLYECSQRHSGGMRRFLLRQDLVQSLKYVLQLSDRLAQRTSFCDGHAMGELEWGLLRSWTARCTTEILLPLICHSVVSIANPCRYYALTRLADLLQGRRYRPELAAQTGRVPALPTEAAPWPGPRSLLQEIYDHDLEEHESWEQQQGELASGDGLRAIVSFVLRLALTRDDTKAAAQRGQVIARELLDCNEAAVRAVWDSAKPLPPQLEPQAREKASPQERIQSYIRDVSIQIQMQLMLRLRCVNEKVMSFFGVSCENFDPTTGRSSLWKMAEVLGDSFQLNSRFWQEQFRSHPSAFEALLAIENYYSLPGRAQLFSSTELRLRNLPIPKTAQASDDLKVLMPDAQVAHILLKKSLVRRAPKNITRADAWASSEFACQQGQLHKQQVGAETKQLLSEGLCDFIEPHGGIVMDPGIVPELEVATKAKYKYSGDVSRVKDISSLIIIYPSIKELAAALPNFIATRRLLIRRVRNRFVLPTNLGRRFFIAHVEVQLPSSEDNAKPRTHVCELRLTVGNSSHYLQPSSHALLSFAMPAIPYVLRRHIQLNYCGRRAGSSAASCGTSQGSSRTTSSAVRFAMGTQSSSLSGRDISRSTKIAFSLR